MTATMTTTIAKPDEVRRPVALMFPGLGDHYANMGRELYANEPTFRAQVDLCAEILRPEIGLDIRTVIFTETEASSTSNDGAAPKQAVDLRRMLGRMREQPSPSASLLDQPRLTQPALFVVEYALAKVWQTWGLRADAMIGYSLGEYVAACLAEVMSLEDSLTVVARRGQLIEALPPGAMLAVSLPEQQLLEVLGEHLYISAINGPEFCVASGPPEAVDDLERRLRERGIAAMRVRSSRAFHSPMMEPIAEPLTALLKTVRLSPPRIPIASNVTGTIMTAAQATDPSYWSTHLCRPVRFADGLRELLHKPGLVLLEAGPGQTLSSLAILQPRTEAGADRVIIASMKNAYDAQSDAAVLKNALQRLQSACVALDATALERSPVGVDALSASGERPSADRSSPDAKTGGSDQSPIERELAAIWKKLFSAEHVEPTDDFFALGGNSLLATRLIFQVRKAYRVNLPLRRVYEAPTLAAMAAMIEGLIGGSKSESGAPASPSTAPAPTKTESSAVRLYTLPNGMEIAHQNEGETKHFYEDIFAHRSYVKNGIRIPRGATVFDVGGNIGLFTLFVHTEAPDAQIYTFEPAPPLFDILRRNATQHQVRVKPFNIGLSNEEREATFTFYPQSTGMSTFHADLDDERHNLKTIIDNQRKLGMAVLDPELASAEELFEVRFQARPFTAKLRRLSDIIREQAVEQIDLLKVDVQKCELEVLEGIDEEDWPKIAQVVLEVHDIDGRLGHLVALLERRGFSVLAEQDTLYVGTNIHNVYAVREGREGERWSTRQ